MHMHVLLIAALLNQPQWSRAPTTDDDGVKGRRLGPEIVLPNIVATA